MAAMIAMPLPGDRKVPPVNAPVAVPDSGFAGILSTVLSGTTAVAGGKGADAADGTDAPREDATSPRVQGRRREASDKEPSRQDKTASTTDPSTILALAQAAVQPAPATPSTPATPAPVTGTVGVRPSEPGTASAGADHAGAVAGLSPSPAATATAPPAVASATAGAAPVAPGAATAGAEPVAATATPSPRAAAVAVSAPSAPPTDAVTAPPTDTTETPRDRIALRTPLAAAPAVPSSTPALPAPAAPAATAVPTATLQPVSAATGVAQPGADRADAAVALSPRTAPIATSGPPVAATATAVTMSAGDTMPPGRGLDAPQTPTAAAAPGDTPPSTATQGDGKDANGGQASPGDVTISSTLLASTPSAVVPPSPTPATARAFPATPGATTAGVDQAVAATIPAPDAISAVAPATPQAMTAAAAVPPPLAAASDSRIAAAAPVPAAGVSVAPIVKQGGDPPAGDQEGGGQQDRRDAAPAVPALTVDAVTATATGSDATPTSQVLDALQTLVAATAPDETSASSPSDSGTVAVQGSGVAMPAGAKSGVVTLELSPANLGRVTVTLRLRSDSLDVQIAVDNKDTLALLSADKGVLSSALGTAHASLDLTYAPTPVVADATPDAPADRRAGGEGQAAADARSGRGGRDDARGAEPSTSKVTSHESSAAPAVRRDDGLYL